MLGRTCEVRMYRGPCGRDCDHGCAHCQVGCFNPARFRNPFFGKDFGGEEYWWRGGYGYAEWLCAGCYDHAVGEAKEFEEMYLISGVEEDPEYTKLLESL
jgi:hypothetical protein